MKVAFEISFRKNSKRTYEAADKGRRGKAFRNARSTGVNKEVRNAIVTLRDRSRHMARNNGWAKRAVEAITRHTIGEGIKPAPIGTLEETKQIKALWRDWANTTACDWDGITNFYGLLELAMRSIAEGGEAVILRRWVLPDEDCEIPMKLQLLEGDQIDHTRNGPNEHGFARMGVQFDNQKRRTGYWVFDTHPGEDDYFGTDKYESYLVDKSDVLLAFEVLRPGQVRGLPMGVASFMKMGDFSDYEDAQLVKQKIAACFAAFVLGSEDSSSDPIEDLEPGIIEHLGSAESVEFANPPSVTDYDPYATRILQGVAAAYGITYEMLTMDYSRVNFTSGRMAKIDVTNNFKSWQYNMVIPQICNPVWDWFIKACLISGKIRRIIKASWTPPRIQQIDPGRETDAQIKAIQGGLTTHSEVLREMGWEPEEFYEEYKQDVERCKELGITISSIMPSNYEQEENGTV